MIESLLLRKVDGLIVAAGRREHPLLHELHRGGTAMVLVNRTSDGLDVPSVVSADEDGVRQLVAHLAELGHQRVAMVGDRHRPRPVPGGHGRS
jgi:LacI family transcriptional regulator